MGNKSGEMENLVSQELFSRIYNKKKVLVTGHTGFKGSWFVLWLKMLGADVRGIALNPTSNPSHIQLLDIDIDSHIQDINNYEFLVNKITEFAPEIVFHFAAQPLVIESYQNPLYTYKTNVIGTANVLEACRNAKSVKSIVVVTTDKVYDNKEWIWGYRENDKLGGYDPYSSSKACVEILCNSYRNSFFNSKGVLLATVRAGNVIGGGDWADNRLIPDIAKAISKKEKLLLRNPNAIRPWQHVLEPLSGYLLIGQKLIESKSDFADAWNFAPDTKNSITVGEIVEIIKGIWNDVDVEFTKTDYHETTFLSLDNSKALRLLQWQPVWNIEQTIEQTIVWYKEFYSSKKLLSKSDILSYIESARKKQIKWATI